MVTDLDLQRLIQTAVYRNEKFALAALRIEQQRARVRLARSQELSKLNGAADYIEPRLSREGLPADKVGRVPRTAP